MILCLEGINGCGKTSLAGALVRHWQSVPGRRATIAEPVQLTEFGRQVRTAIMTTKDLQVEAETLAFASCRLNAVRQLAEVGADESHLVVIERWAGAVVAYGRAVGADRGLTAAMEDALSRGLGVARTVLVDVPGGVADYRLRAQPVVNRFETAGAAYLERVRQAYLEWASARHVLVVDGTRPVNTLVDSLIAQLLGAK